MFFACFSNKCFDDRVEHHCASPVHFDFDINFDLDLVADETAGAAL